jgi:hypothetical protein
MLIYRMLALLLDYPDEVLARLRNPRWRAPAWCSEF